MSLIGSRERLVGVCVALLLFASPTAALVHEAPAGTTVSTAAAPPGLEPGPGPVFESEDTTPTPPEATAEPPSTAPTAAAPPEPKPAAAVPPRTEKPPAPAAARTRSAGGDFGPRPPGSASFPFDANRTSWSHTQDGVTMHLTVDRQSVGWGEPFTFTMTVTSDRSCCGASLLYGDGDQFDQQPAEACGAGPGTGGTRTFKATKYYPKPGRWEFQFQASNGNCNTDFHNYAALYGWINVVEGPPPPNGPAVPEVFWTYEQGPEQYQDGKRRIGIEVWARDADGHIREFTIDWGDGTPVQNVGGDPRPCHNGANGWPPGDEYTISPNPEHWFQQGADVNRIKVTVTSRGCDGGAAQTGASGFPSPPRNH